MAKSRANFVFLFRQAPTSARQSAADIGGAIYFRPKGQLLADNAYSAQQPSTATNQTAADVSCNAANYALYVDAVIFREEMTFDQLGQYVQHLDMKLLNAVREGAAGCANVDAAGGIQCLAGFAG
jgi:hypothetical protein